MSYCLQKEELIQVLEHMSDRSGRGLTGALASRYEDAMAWQEELVSLNYLFGQVLLGRKARGDAACDVLVESYYLLQDRMWFTGEECDSRFVDFMLRHQRDRVLDLTDELIELATKHRTHHYRDAIRL